jgi:ABC-type Zn uptake system ZnuABC Zn-binding protein ZnuA
MLVGVRTILVIAAGLAVVTAAIAALGGSSAAEGRGVPVVATTTQAADLTRAVGGDRVAVHRVLAPNTDPHDYEVRARDVKALSGARLVVRSGGDVDGWLEGAVESAGTDAPVLDLIAAAGPEGDDPHWWQDPRRAERAVAAIRRALTDADPAGAAGYAERARAYSARLRALDAAVARCIATIPPGQRTLVTTHDALGYYARRYGLRVVGTVIPSLSTEAQASAGDLARLVDTIRRTGVKAVFAESSVNPKVEKAIADEAGAVVGKPLWADSLGPKGSSGATYIGSIRANTQAIAEGLGAERCSLSR